jgi:hypothetical protein
MTSDKSKTFAQSAVASEPSLRLGRDFDNPDHPPPRLPAVTASKAEIVTFDYSTLAPDVATAAKDAADRIRRRIEAGIIETGHDLIAVKASLDHGQFKGWLDAEFGMSVRTAQNYMAAAEWSKDKNEIVAHLPPTTIYLLAAASTPEPARAAVIEHVKKGETLTVKAVKEIVAEERDKAEEKAKQEAEAARRSKLTPEQKKKEDRSRAAREKRKQEKEEENRRWREENDRKKANALRLAEIIVAAVKDDAEVVRLAADCDEWTLGRIIVAALAGKG